MSIRKQISFTFFAQLVCLLISFFYGILIARALGPELRGIYFVLQSYSLLITVLSSVSVQTIMTVSLSRKEFDIYEVNTSSIILSLVLGILGGGLGLVIFVITTNVIQISYFNVVLFFAVTPFLLYKLMWHGIMLGIRKIIIMNLFSIIDFSLLTILTLILINLLKHPLKGVIISFIISAITGVLIQLLLLQKDFGIKWKFSANCISELLKLGWKQHIAMIAYQLYMRADAFILSIYSNPMNTGYYSVAKGLTEKITIAVNPVTMVMFPHISAADSEKSKKYTKTLIKYIFLIILMISIVFTIFAPFIITALYGEAYKPSITHARILVFSMLFLLLQVPINLWFVGNLKKPILNSYVNLLTLFLVGLSGILFVNFIGDYGMSWALFSSYSLSTLFAFWLSNKHKLKINSIFFRKEEILNYLSQIRLFSSFK